MSSSSDAQGASPASRALHWTVPGRRLNPLASVRLHRWFSLLLAVIVLGLGVSAALIFGRHEYLAEAELEVAPNFPNSNQTNAAPFSSDEQYRGFVDQQVAEIDSYATTSVALKLLGKNRWFWQQPSETERFAAERLVHALTVTPITNTYLISVSLTGSEPQGLARIVNAVVNAYLQRRQRRDQQESDQRAQFLVQQRASLERESEALRVRESQLAQELGVSTFGPTFVSPYDRILSEGHASLDGARRTTIQAQARLQALQADQQRLAGLEVKSEALQKVANDPDINSARAELTKQRETLFLELQQLGPNHPGRPALQHEIDEIQEEIARLQGSDVDRLSAIIRKARATGVQREIVKAQTEVDQAQRVQQGIEQELKQLQAKAASFGTKYNEAQAVDRNLINDGTQIQQIDQQIGLLRLETESPGFVSLESAAMTPDLPVKSKRRIILMIFLALALVSAIGLPTRLDMMDPLIRTSDELEAIVGFPPFGAVLGSPGPAAREALRRIALAIIRECRACEVRTFVLTAVSDREASSALTITLADQLRSLGIRAIALKSEDFTGNLPEHANGSADDYLHTLSSRAAHGLASNGHNGVSPIALDIQKHGEASLPATDCLAAAGRNLSAIPASEVSSSYLPKPGFDRSEEESDSPFELSSGNPESPFERTKNGSVTGEAAELGAAMMPAERQPRWPSSVTVDSTEKQESTLTPKPVRTFLDSIRSAYDLVLFDAPPILTSADAEMLIQAPAGAILVVRSGHDVPRDVKAATRRLERVAPPVVGTVMSFEPDNHKRSPQAIIRRWLAAQ
jgi:uncharacterized protein involved in exopolysaccharide biosynthesis